jgi:outer membrane biosynthesis protein TonB
MRSEAQRQMHAQGLIPASGPMGIHISVGTQAAINKAFQEWKERRGIDDGDYYNRRTAAAAAKPAEAKPEPVQEAPKPPKPPKAPKPSKAAPAPKVALTAEERKAQQKKTRLAWRERNRERIREQARLFAQKWRESLTPEQRKEVSAKVMAYAKAAKQRAIDAAKTQ